MAINVDSVKQILLPKRKPNEKGIAYTNTFNPSATGTALSLPTYRSHLEDIFTNRQSLDSRALLKDLVKFDTDVSASLHAYLTVADTEPRFYVYDMENQLDREGMKTLESVLNGLVLRNDYTQNFDLVKSLREIASDCRYMTLLRGGVAVEAIFNKLLVLSDIRQIDLATVEFLEPTPGTFKPQQKPANSTQPISLDSPNIFIKFYRQNPTEAYSESLFVSAINTIAARQQVINDLYRIMQKTGYPRLEVVVVEEVLRKNAPANVRAKEEDLNTWVNAKMTQIASAVSDMRPDSAFVHADSIETKILNKDGPGAALNVTDIISVLNSQNQAGLKTVSTLIGRGEAGVNTASVEARVFSMSADSLNAPVADLFSDLLTLALRYTGYEGYVKCVFDKAELRPATELEPQLLIKQSRLKADLSDGLISDDEYHIMMYGRVRPDSAPELSGTKFIDAAGAGGGPDATSVTPNQDTLGRSISAPGGSAARSDRVKKTKTATPKK